MCAYFSKVRRSTKGHGCLCRLYTSYLMYDPKEEEKQGNVEIVGVKYVQGNFVDAYRCRCLQCGAEYHVEEREYHYTWWGWRALAQTEAIEYCGYL
jgi:hypothetical protein